MLPECALQRLFPDCAQGLAPSRPQLELFAEYWDDGESERTNVEAIAWWLNQVDREPQDSRCP